MLKLVFALLLAANALLFAYHQGYLETLLPSGHEPARMRKQLNADKIRLIEQPLSAAPAKAAPATPAAEPVAASAAVAVEGAAAAETATATPAAATAPAATPVAPQEGGQAAREPERKTVACTEIGNFSAAEARRFEVRLASLAPAVRPKVREVSESSSHMVLIPPKDGKEGADRMVAELRRLEVDDFHVIQDNSERRWGVSLGIFRTEEAAHNRLAALGRKGVRGAQLLEYKVTLNRLAYQLRGLDAQTLDGLEKIRAGFPRLEMRGCA